MTLIYRDKLGWQWCGSIGAAFFSNKPRVAIKPFAQCIV